MFFGEGEALKSAQPWIPVNDDGHLAKAPVKIGNKCAKNRLYFSRTITFRRTYACSWVPESSYSTKKILTGRCVMLSATT